LELSQFLIETGKAARARSERWMSSVWLHIRLETVLVKFRRCGEAVALLASRMGIGKVLTKSRLGDARIGSK
jgi:hypothetical protein